MFDLNSPKHSVRKLAKIMPNVIILFALKRALMPKVKNISKIIFFDIRLTETSSSYNSASYHKSWIES